MCLFVSLSGSESGPVYLFVNTLSLHLFVPVSKFELRSVSLYMGVDLCLLVFNLVHI